MLDLIIFDSLFWGVEIAIECTSFFMHEEYFLGMVFDKSEWISIKILHLFLLIIFNLIIDWFIQTNRHKIDLLKDLLNHKNILLKAISDIACIKSL